MKKLGVLLLLCFSVSAKAQDSFSLHARFDQSKMDGVKTITLQVEAPDGLDREYLVIRCSTKLDAYIATDTVISGEYEEEFFTHVRFRTESSKATSENWLRSDDDEGAFSRRPKSFLMQIRHSNQLILEYTPFEKTERTITFDIGGLDEQLNKYYECRRLFDR